jgi:RNA polymerase sigma-70 factor (ECF subfamily)
MGEEALSDRVLVKRLLRGEERAFEAFFASYFPRLYRFALARLGHDHDAAEDAVQATLCRAITVLASWRGEASLFTWLCTLCRREIGARFREQSREPAAGGAREAAPDDTAALESLAASVEGSPENALQRRELTRLIQAILDFLPSAYGDALEWKYVLGLSVREIARLLGVSPKAAESTLTRAREAFRREFMALTGDRPELRPRSG